MNAMIPSCLLAVALSISGANSAMAVPVAYNFSYEFVTGEIFSGMLEGELQADLDTVLVSNLIYASFTGLPGFGIQTALFPQSNIVTFSGSGAYFASTAPFGNVAAFAIPLNGFAAGGTAIISTQQNILFRVEPFAAQRWQLRAKSVPTISTMALVLCGVLGLMRRRARGSFSVGKNESLPER